MATLTTEPEVRSKKHLTFSQGLKLLGPYVVPAVVFSSGVFAFFTPVLFILLGKRGRPQQILTALATNSLVLYGMGQIRMIPVFLLFTTFFSIGTLTLVELAAKRKTWTDGGLLTFITGLWLALTLLGGSILCQILFRQGLLASLGHFWLEMSKDVPLQVKQEWFGDVSEAEFILQLPYQVTSALVSISIFTSWLCLQTATALSPIRRELSRKIGFKVSDFFLIPTMLLWAWALFETQIRAMGLAWVPSVHTGRVFGVVLQGFASLYFLQGLTVFGQILAQYNVPRFFRMILALAVIMLMLPTFAFIGGLDALIDLRKRLAPKGATKID